MTRRRQPCADGLQAGQRQCEIIRVRGRRAWPLGSERTFCGLGVEPVCWPDRRLLPTLTYGGDCVSSLGTNLADLRAFRQRAHQRRPSVGDINHT